MLSRRPYAIAGASLVATALTLGCMKATASAANAVAVPAAVPPKLIVFITVDQLRGDMLDRYRADLHGGYARLMSGAWFVNAYQDHAITETAPGHASTMSGRFPRSTGITSNLTGVIDPNYRLIDAADGEIGASPERFRGTTVYDWLKARDARSKAFSASKKDRGAILPIGRSKSNVYWYSGNGNFTTSNYYRDSLPTWVQQFNARHLGQRYAGRAWTLSRDPSTYAEPDSVPFENNGRDFMFPHALPADSAVVTRVLPATPFMDSVTALFALEAARQLALGAGPQTDLLAVSFSATDYVGHAYGPDSREAHENEIRLDQTIGWFIDSLYRMRDSSTIVFALTGDHGASPIPELARARGEAKGNEALRVNLRPLVSQIRSGLGAAGADTNAFFYDFETVSLDRAALAKARLNADSILNAFAAAAKAVPGVWRVDRIRDLRRVDPAADPFARRWSHQIPDVSAVELVITLTRYSNYGGIPATHGSPWDQDAHVPIIFYGPWIRPGRYTQFARVVDMAPTLAAIAALRPLEKLDGIALRQAIR
ncbi:MAG TPA: alkaline phosphatase family protein [Gemmatimonadaceae bacterium]|nr:alkaline phosphatase family protein [Gemmatimonadaceae bacterium]